jgi:hypothetical protein
MAVRKTTQKLDSKVEIIDAHTALDWLDTQIQNRSINAATVRSYKEEMRAGRWELNGEAIKFDVDGHLIDGQHRLLALSQTVADEDSVLIESMVVRGLPPTTQRSMDGGSRRQAGQQLGMRNIANSFNIASVARFWTMLHTKDGKYDPGALFGEQALKVSNLSIELWVDDHPDEVAFANTYMSGIRKIETRPGMSGAVLLILAEANQTAALEFFDGVIVGANLPLGSPILALRNRFDSARRTREKLSDRDVLGFYLQAWSFWRRGRQLGKVHRPREEWIPRHFEIEP